MLNERSAFIPESHMTREIRSVSVDIVKRLNQRFRTRIAENMSGLAAQVILRERVQEGVSGTIIELELYKQPPIARMIARVSKSITWEMVNQLMNVGRSGRDLMSIMSPILDEMYMMLSDMLLAEGINALLMKTIDKENTEKPLKYGEEYTTNHRESDPEPKEPEPTDTGVGQDYSAFDVPYDEFVAHATGDATGTSNL